MDRTSVPDRALAHALSYAQELIEGSFFTTASFNQIPEHLLQLKASTPGNRATSMEWKQWAANFQFARFKALELNPEQVLFSTEELRAFGNSLYATEILVRCKESAVRISQSSWEEIEARLLTLDEIPA
ncbi:hypothetical protein H6G13_26540 [Pseudanabaena sp. FACHB-2040]|nr:hypothetical protein [Pseudanabaena sp. FACHB-2040]